MFNPLVENLHDKTDNELDEKLKDLRKKYFQVRNPEVKQQIINTLNTYQEEIDRRRAEARRKEQENQDDDLGGLINIS